MKDVDRRRSIADRRMQAAVDQPAGTPNRRWQDVAAEHTAEAAVCRARGRSYGGVMTAPRRDGDERDGGEVWAAAEKPLASAIRNGRVIGAEEELARLRCRQAPADVQVDPVGAAARLLVEVCKAERRDVIEDAHPVRGHDRCSSDGVAARIIRGALRFDR